jgi:predicted transcriptional regulator
MSQTKVDDILGVVGNPARRRILKHLSNEPDYPLRLSQALGLGQQLVTKHLKVMEDLGLVAAYGEASPTGPDRKLFTVSKYVTIYLEFTPNLYLEHVGMFNSLKEILGAEGSSAKSLASKIPQARGLSDLSYVGKVGDLIEEIDETLLKLEMERAKLLYVRSLALKQATGNLRKYSHEKRHVIRHLLGAKDDSAKRISRSLGMKEDNVEKILTQFRETEKPRNSAFQDD